MKFFKKHSRTNSNNVKAPDKVLLVMSIILSVVGLLVIADSSAPLATVRFSNSLYFVKEQAISVGVAIVAMLVASRVDYLWLKKMAVPFFIISIIILAAVLIPGVGYKVLGARRWINIAGFDFQPSEIAKLTLVIYLAKAADSVKKLPSFLSAIVLVVGLIMLEPDLGTALIVSGIAFSILIVSGVSLMSLFKIGIAGIMSVVALIATSDYRRERIMTFLEASTDPLGRSYHIRQVLLALGSGGLFGVGIGHSRQKYLFLPESATDSVFAVIGEEIGLVGASFIMAVFIYLVYRILKIAKRAPDTFGMVLSAGVAGWIAFQVLLNIGSMVAIVPLTGVPLPFLSYGGSSLVVIMTAIGIVLNISTHVKSKS